MESWWLPYSAATAILCTMCWALTRRWYRRQIAGWMQRFDKAERKNHQAAQQMAQTRKQIEKLQRELSEARRAAAVASSQLGSQRARAAAETKAASAAPAPAGTGAPSNGFADTMPM